jgi:CubicO group peptidase (beta-lactamase class C family)
MAEAFGGLADPAAGVEPGPATRFGTASVTKMFTAIAVARQVERGALGFESRVSEVLPADWYPAALDRSATVHNLLTHTSGIPDYIPDEDPTTPDLWLALGNPGIRRAADFVPILQALPAGTPPTTVANYCNAGYVILGLVLEATSGVSYTEAIAADVFEPAGMGDSGFFAFDELPRDVAVGWLPPDAELAQGRTNVDLLPIAGAPDGGAFCTTRDLVSFFVALHRGDLLAPATRDLLLTPSAYGASGDTGVGYGQLIREHGARRWFGHGGSDPAVSARAFHSPADGVSLIVLSNRTDGAGDLWRRLADALPAA